MDKNRILWLLCALLGMGYAASAAPEVIGDTCDWSKYAPLSNPAYVWTQVAPGDGGTEWYLRIHPADDKCVLHSCDMIATYLTLYGKLPAVTPQTPAWLIVDGKAQVVNTLKEVWEKAATPEARKAGFETIWYVAENAKATWDGKEFKVLEFQK